MNNWTNIKMIFRNFRKEKVSSLINIVGFAFSIAICFIITIYVIQENGYDTFHKNFDSIYRITNAETNNADVDNTIKEDVLANLPEVKDYCHLLLNDEKSALVHENEIAEIRYVLRADNGFFKVFSFPILFGNQDTPFDKNISSVLISKSVSTKLFGDKNPIGEIVTLYNRWEYTVAAVFDDFPDNSSIKADVIRNEAYEVSENSNVSCRYNKCEYIRNVFFTVNNNKNIDQLTENLNHQLALQDKFLKKVQLHPLSDIYLKNEANNSSLLTGNLKLTNTLSKIAIITLLLASINYINLSIAQYKKRVKEVGVKKTIGASRLNLIYSFLSESLIVTLISGTLSIFIVIYCLPLFSKIFQLHVQLADIINPIKIGVVLVFFISIGLINGFIPAMIITSFKPINIFQKKSERRDGKYWLKNSLTIFQFVVSITLIICVMTIFKQLSFIKHKDLGFNDSYLIKIKTDNLKKQDIFKNELLKSSYIVSACYSSGVPGEINWGRSAGIDANGYDRGVKVIGSDESFLPTFKMKLLAGRNILAGERDKTCLVNKTAMKRFDWKSYEGKYFNRWENIEGLEVVGVVDDFHFKSMEKKIEPIIISYQDYQNSFLSVRISGINISEAMFFIKKTWRNLEPNEPIPFAFYDDLFDSMYKKEEQLASMISIFAILAIVISCLGIFGQAMLNTTNRIKEIGIRKVNGAKIIEVVALLNKDFIVLIFISLIIAAPIARLYMYEWLDKFAYKSGLSWWVIVLAGIITIMVTLVTVSWQSWLAARKNPVKALRYE